MRREGEKIKSRLEEESESSKMEQPRVEDALSFMNEVTTDTSPNRV